MNNRKSRVWLRVALCVLSIVGMAADARKVPAQDQMATHLETPSWSRGRAATGSPASKPELRVAGGLRAIGREFEGWKAARSALPATAFRARHPLAPVAGGYVTIDAVAEEDAGALLEQLRDLGLKQGARSGHLVSGRLPLAALSAVEAMPGIKRVRPAYVKRRAGSVTSEGDRAIVADLARASWGLDGSGVTVGVMSDSFDCLGGETGGNRSEDLPAVAVLEEGPCVDDPNAIDLPVTDEGRAMLEIVHDLAPGAALVFRTAEGGQANFADGILDLQSAGAKVIVDDVLYLTEPMFQDGVVALAVDRVAARGTAYFSAAGNEARQSYERRFRDSERTFDYGYGAVPAHDFDASPGVDPFQRITIPEGGCGLFVLQWAQPFRSVSGAPGSATDIDILLLNTQHTIAYMASLEDNVGDDPIETLEFCNDLGTGETAFDLIITRFGDTRPERMKYVYWGDVTVEEHGSGSGTVFGHPNAAGAEAVGAVDYQSTPAFGQAQLLPEPFSSAGGVAVLFDAEGQALAKPALRRKPGVMAPDGVNTTFFADDREDDADGLPNFFGTSAAAPHAAAVAALILQANPTLYPQAVYERLRATADDMGPPGFDFGTGYGLVNAERAALPLPAPSCAGEIATITGSTAGEPIVGTAGRDVIVAGGGNDEVDGRGGDDLLCGGAGKDSLFGGAGRDRLLGGAGNDHLDGGQGRNRLIGGSGRDLCGARRSACR
jgi:Ca2+-binding RTX toxin-like protein